MLIYFKLSKTSTAEPSRLLYFLKYYTWILPPVCVCVLETHSNILPSPNTTFDMFATMQTLNTYCTHMHTEMYHVVVRAVCWITGCLELGEGGEKQKWRREAEVWRWRQAGRTETDCLCAWGSVCECITRQSILAVCACGLVCVSSAHRPQQWSNWLNELLWNIELNSINRIICYLGFCVYVGRCVIKIKYEISHDK